jgi:hypothetical protein
MRPAACQGLADMLHDLSSLGSLGPRPAQPHVDKHTLCNPHSILPSDDVLCCYQRAFISIMKRLATHRDEEVRNRFLIACRRFAVFPPASGNVSCGAMNDHHHEEDKVEPRERAPRNTILVNTPCTPHKSTGRSNLREPSDRSPR